MLSAPRVMSFRVADLEAARRWYGALLDRQPILDAPFAVAFALGDCVLLLLPRESSGQTERPVPFFGVEDIEGAFSRLVGAGAAARSEITFTTWRSTSRNGPSRTRWSRRDSIRACGRCSSGKV